MLWTWSHVCCCDSLNYFGVGSLPTLSFFFYISFFSPFLPISLCRAGHYFSHPVISILCHVFSQLVFLHVFLYVVNPSLIWSASAPSPRNVSRLSDFAHMWLCSRLKQWSNHFSLVFQEIFNRFYVRLLTDVFISDVIQPGLPPCPSQHPLFGWIYKLIFTSKQNHSVAFEYKFCDNATSDRACNNMPVIS